MLSKWIYAVVGASVLCAVCTSLVADGRAKKALEFVCGIVMIAAVLSPLTSLDFDEYTLSVAKYRQEARAISATADERKELLDRRYIEQEYSAYIFDKARMNGVIPDEVNVSTQWSTDGYWYPVSVEIILSSPEYEKDSRAIKYAIESELGIPISEQYWRLP
ncbi:MAG: hypothetical protein Q4A83_02125 [Bacillota bacterium]|nr:hypothetical protein [Bacillota bacterium]